MICSFKRINYDNDPSAGSPTETLLRLLTSSKMAKFGVLLVSSATVARASESDPNTSLNHSIGSSDGRCVQRAGT